MRPFRTSSQACRNSRHVRGLNTIANWSDETVRLLRRTPYTDTLSSRGAKNIEGSDGYWGKFPDVFDATYDEENYQIGFVDIADTPYRETIEASRDVGERIYRIRLENSSTLVPR